MKYLDMSEGQKFLTIFVNRNKLVFVDPVVSELKEFVIPVELVKDLEVLDVKSLQKGLAEFIKKSGIKTTKVVMVFAQDTYLETEIEKKDQAEKEELVEKFSDLVPFEDIFVKELDLEKVIKVIAINRGFYEPILNVLYGLKFEIKSIFPESAVLTVLGKFEYNHSSSNSIVGSLNKLDFFNFLESEKKSALTKNLNPEEAAKSKKRMFILLPVFGLLILILGFLLFKQFNEKPVTPQVFETTQAPSASEDLSLEESDQATESADLEETEPVELDLTSFKIRVLNGSGIVGQSGLVRDGLEELGFVDVEIGNAKTNNSGETFIVFATGLPVQVKELILSEVENLGQEYQIQENRELKYAAVITTAQP